MNLNFLKFNQRTTDAISIKMKWAPEGKRKARDRKNHLGTLGKKYLKNRQKKSKTKIKKETKNALKETFEIQQLLTKKIGCTVDGNKKLRTGIIFAETILLI